MTRIFPRNANAVPTSIASASLTNNNKGTAVEKNTARNTNGDGKNINLQLLSESATKREKLQSPPPLLSMAPTMLPAGATARQLPMPKLNEIGKSRPNGPVRQQNASVRNVPNPSALAFRNQATQQKPNNERSSPPTAVPAATTTSVANSGTSPKSRSPTHPLVTRSPVSANDSTDVVSSTTKSLGNHVTSSSTSASTTTTTAAALLLSSLTPMSKQLKAPTLTKQHSTNQGGDANGATGHGRNNNNDITDAKLIAAKKNQHIEKLAANLRAAAANDATPQQRLSLATVPKSTATSLSS